MGTMELVFSVMTHPAPGTNVPGGSENERFISVPLALGPRWLAYAANQVVDYAQAFLSKKLLQRCGQMPCSR